MTHIIRKMLPWSLFVLILAATFTLGNRAVQNAAMKDYDAEYTEYHLNYLEKEVARLRAQNHKLQQELEDIQIDD
jgi:uncharacterized protein YlxW (UPF0749 family)